MIKTHKHIIKGWTASGCSRDMFKWGTYGYLMEDWYTFKDRPNYNNKEWNKVVITVEVYQNNPEEKRE